MAGWLERGDRCATAATGTRRFGWRVSPACRFRVRALVVHGRVASAGVVARMLPWGGGGLGWLFGGGGWRGGEGVSKGSGGGEVGMFVRRALWRADRGSGTVWVVAFAAVIWVGGVAAVAVGGVRAARHRADSAADLAALAGAGRVMEGRAGVCGKAKSIAAEFGAELVRCRVEGEDVEVLVSVNVQVPMGLGAVTVGSRARAGPTVPMAEIVAPSVDKGDGMKPLCHSSPPLRSDTLRCRSA
ncbi:secretion/DNA translocation related TadE-like protein [Actinomadura pelletieri DSM 43383]|uniref:Secretion/DNA translocation related TadE-like protein n=2 Tax=Actinomadura pelletieri TaxID=111805 RepID=A0A495QYS0_9ACTN|nr:secretion/DNA translocation related TadE-like protein [Actinomadura pelletieri DSM 43383]